MLRDFDLVLDICRSQIRLQMIVSVSCALAECHRGLDTGVGVRDRNRSRSVVEITGVPKIIRKLAAKLCTTQYRMARAASRNKVDQIGLVEYIPAARRIVVSGNCNESFVRIDGTRHKVLVSAIIIAERHTVLNTEPAGLVFDGRRAEIQMCPDVAVVGVPKVR